MATTQYSEPHLEKKRKSGFHYAWVICIVTFAVLLVSAGVRTAAGVFIKPFEAEFGWDRASISLAVAVSLFIFGFGGPIGGSLVDRFGARRVMLGGLVLILLGVGPMLIMTSLLELYLFWGVLAGVGTGAVAQVMGATVANRWFVKRRGLIVGLFGAASSAGQMIFLPALMGLTTGISWRAAVGAIAIAVGVMIIPALIFMRDKPEDVGQRAYGDDGMQSEAAKADAARGTPLREAVKTRDFWLLAGSFFICGYTSNGLVGTHLIPHAVEHGFTEVTAASAVAVMGMMNVVGTLASGWLSDRYDNRVLLAAYYGFRAIAIAFLPFVIEFNGLLIFAIVYGLDWIATVPPTVNLTARRFGRASLGTLYGWIFCAHMIGAGIAAYAGGFFRQMLGDYHLMFFSAAFLGFVAVIFSLGIRAPRKTPVATPA
jgi:MFS family permease